eukprot:SAG11_NODE_2159_length_3730_cov_1.805288_2_plen_116_part_00
MARVQFGSTPLNSVIGFGDSSAPGATQGRAALDCGGGGALGDEGRRSGVGSDDGDDEAGADSGYDSSGSDDFHDCYEVPSRTTLDNQARISERCSPRMLFSIRCRVSTHDTALRS